ncbi:MAG TPA: hypothetical protein VFV83_01260 [Chthoniobacteraceae bacterium]|nr:hypothetical protein [Chthoniobacteraceae bacterium]
MSKASKRRRAIRRRILRSGAILASSLASMLPHGHVKAEENGNKYSKKLRESVLTRPDLQPLNTTGLTDPPMSRADLFQWRNGIVTTTFWIGENATKNNPVPNYASSWDVKWSESFGGTDTPDRRARTNFMPANFVPRQNPFYVALPYNDVQKGGHKPEASRVIPWFKEAYKGPGKSVLKGRWIAIRYKGRVAYAQWEDCGPFRTDHWQYVFGNERPKPNLNKGAGLDVSPAVRDYLGMADTDVTDWKFVEFAEVPTGPWATHGDNNTFVINKRAEETRLALARTSGTPATPPPSSSTSVPPPPQKTGIIE